MSDTDVKKLIISSAKLHFSKYGFHKTTMDEIARHIHKAKGVLYYYFKSKEELFKEVLRQELNDVKKELSAITESNDDSLNILNNYILTRLKLLSTAFNYHETIKADFFEEYHFVKDVRNSFAKFEQAQLYKIILKGMEEGYLDIKNLDSNVKILLLLLYGVEYQLFLQNKYSEFEKTIEELANMIMSSLRSQILLE